MSAKACAGQVPYPVPLSFSPAICSLVKPSPYPWRDSPMERTRTAPTLVEVLVILAVSTVLIILLTFTINRVRQVLAEAPPALLPNGSSEQDMDIKQTDSMLK